MSGKRSELTRVACFVALFAVSVTTISAVEEDISCLSAEHGMDEAPSTSSGYQPAPTAVMQRVAVLQGLLGITQLILVVDEPGRGIGRARPPCLNSGRRSDLIATDVEALQRADSTRPMAADLILAHELSHVLQFHASADFVASLCAGTLRDVKVYELLADFGAGYAMCKIGNQNARQNFVRTVSSLADYQFTAVRHHGTVTERLNAFDMGQASGYFGQELKMEALIRNREAFLRLLGGPEQRNLEAGSTTFGAFTRNALAEVYR